MRIILDSLEAQMHEVGPANDLDRAMADALVRGAGYLRLTPAGVEHIPFDDVQIREHSDRDKAVQP